MNNRNAQDLLYGMNVVREVVRAGRRKVARVYWARREKDKDFQEMRVLCGQHSIPFTQVPFHEIEHLTGSKETQGVAVEVAPFMYAELGDIIAQAKNNSKGGFVILLDEIQDPHNVGAIIRTAHALGASGLVLLKHRQAPITPSVCKAAAGATEYLPIVMEVNLVNVILTLKEFGFFIYGAAGVGGASIFKEKPMFPAGLVLGSEGTGLRRLVRENCDQLLTIPMEGKIDSLNVSVAAGILMSQIVQKRPLSS